jgi:hypothetical protein
MGDMSGLDMLPNDESNVQRGAVATGSAVFTLSWDSSSYDICGSGNSGSGSGSGNPPPAQSPVTAINTSGFDVSGNFGICAKGACGVGTNVYVLVTQAGFLTVQWSVSAILVFNRNNGDCDFPDPGESNVTVSGYGVSDADADELPLGVPPIGMGSAISVSTISGSQTVFVGPGLYSYSAQGGVTTGTGVDTWTGSVQVILSVT